MANIRTFKNLQDEVLAWLDEAGDTDVTYTLVKQSLRAAHEKRLTEERWQFMLVRPRTFTTVAGQQFYSLDPEFLRALYFKNITLGDMMVEWSDQNVLPGGLDWTTDTGGAGDYVLWGQTPVANQPSSASVVAVTSSNAADNAVASVTIIGNTASGSDSETILAAASGLLSFTEITKVTKSAGWAGTMTLTTNAAAVTNLTLKAAEYGRSYQTIYLLNLQAGGEVIEYRFYKQPAPLVADNDRCDFPPPFETLLVWDALLDLGTYNEYSPNLIAYWSRRRDELLLTMQQNTNIAQSMNRRAAYTEYVPR